MDNGMILLIGTMFGAIGAGITYVVMNSREHGQFKQALCDIRELLKEVVSEHKQTRRDVDKIQERCDMVMKAGNIIKSHDNARTQ